MAASRPAAGWKIFKIQEYPRGIHEWTQFSKFALYPWKFFRGFRGMEAQLRTGFPECFVD